MTRALIYSPTRVRMFTCLCMRHTKTQSSFLLLLSSGTLSHLCITALLGCYKSAQVNSSGVKTSTPTGGCAMFQGGLSPVICDT